MSVCSCDCTAPFDTCPCQRDGCRCGRLECPTCMAKLPDGGAYHAARVAARLVAEALERLVDAERVLRIPGRRLDPQSERLAVAFNDLTSLRLTLDEPTRPQVPAQTVKETTP